MNHKQLSRSVLSLILMFGAVFLIPTESRANEKQDLKNQVKELQQKVAQLEQQLSAKPAAPATVVFRPVKAPFYSINDEWDPFAQMRMMQHQMDQMMKESAADFDPKEDIKETPEAYIISIDIPGMQKDKINVEVKNKALIISGVRENEVQETGPDHFYRQERSFGNFLRILPLPEDAKADSIDAQYSNGVLTVKVERSKTNNTAPGKKIQVK